MERLFLAVLALLAVPVASLPTSGKLLYQPKHIRQASLENSLNGVHLTIVTTEDPPFMKVRDSPNAPIKPWTEWEGWIKEVIQAVSDAAGFTYTLQLSSSTATTAYGQSDNNLADGGWRGDPNGTTSPSEYPALDQGPNGFGFGSSPTAHWAGAYITHPRLARFHMTAPFATSPVSLLVPVNRINLDTSTAIDWTDPFDNMLWAQIAGGFLFAAMVVQMVERHDKAGMFSWSKSTPVRWKVWWMKEWVYSTFFSLTNMKQTLSWNSSTAEGRLFKALWSITCLVIVVNYTAKLSASVILRSGDTSQSSTITNSLTVQDFLETGTKLRACVLANSAYAKGLAAHPTYMGIQQVACSGLEIMVEKLNAGACDGIIERAMHLEYIAAVTSKALTSKAINASFAFGEKMDSEETGLVCGGIRTPSACAVVEALQRPPNLAVMLKKTINDYSFSTTKDIQHNSSVIAHRLGYWITKLRAAGEIDDLYRFEVLHQVTKSTTSEVKLIDFGMESTAAVVWIVAASLALLMKILQVLREGIFKALYERMEKDVKTHLRNWGAVQAQEVTQVIFSQSTTNLELVASIVDILEADHKIPCFFQRNISLVNSSKWMSQWMKAEGEAEVGVCVLSKKYLASRYCCMEWDVMEENPVGRLVLAADPVGEMLDAGPNDHNGGPLMYLKGGGQVIDLSRFSTAEVVQHVISKLQEVHSSSSRVAIDAVPATTSSQSTSKSVVPISVLPPVLDSHRVPPLPTNDINDDAAAA